MPTELQVTRFRNDLAADENVFDDTEVDEMYLMAEEEFPDSPKSIEIQVRIIAVRRLLFSSAKMTDYVANATEEKLSQVNTALQKRLEDLQKELGANPDSLPSVRFGGLKVKPSRIVEYPDA